MQKISGKICDSCRVMFYPGDKVYEFCHECANFVWCVTNIYEDGSKELSSIHHTEESALDWVEKSKNWINEVNKEVDNKIINQEIVKWCVL